MKIAIDVTPLKKERVLWHRVRGTGFYIENLKKALEEYFPENQYTYFTRGEKLPKDIDLVHYPYFEPFFLTLPLRKKFPTVVTVHDLIPLVFPDKFPRGVKGEIKWQIQKWSLKTAKMIITDSENSKKDIIEFTGIGENKINVIYLAPGEEFRKLEGGNWKVETGEKYKLPDKFALYVGDATWNKNLPRLIEAVKMINIPLVMVGKMLVEKDFAKDNPWNQDLVKIQQLAKSDKRIIRPGFVPTEDLVALYNLATVFVMPSIYEGFGLPVLEAMACGCPVVAGDAGSLPEICGDAAIMVKPDDVNDIARGLARILHFNKSEYNYQAKKGFNWVKKFSWEKVAKETIKVYEGV